MAADPLHVYQPLPKYLRRAQRVEIGLFEADWRGFGDLIGYQGEDCYMSVNPVIDWTQAEEQVRGDLAFLAEVLGDMLQEADQALGLIRNGIETRQFLVCMKAAHQLKGSASYLYCGDVLRCASIMQDLGNEGATASNTAEGTDRSWNGNPPRDTNAIWNDILQIHDSLIEAVNNLRNEVSAKFQG